MTLIYKDAFIVEYVHNLDGNYEIDFNNVSNFKGQVDIGCAANQLLFK